MVLFKPLFALITLDLSNNPQSFTLLWVTGPLPLPQSLINLRLDYFSYYRIQVRHLKNMNYGYTGSNRLRNNIVCGIFLLGLIGMFIYGVILVVEATED